MVHLNDKWALDGRDPNGYANVSWCFGLHDRPWPERAVFGTVRTMTSASARKKLDFEDYIDALAWLSPVGARARGANRRMTPAIPWLRGLNQRITPLIPRFSGLNQRIAPLIPWFSGLNQRIAPLIPWFSGLNQRITPLIPRFSGLNQRITPLIPRLTALIRRMTPLIRGMIAIIRRITPAPRPIRAIARAARLPPRRGSWLLLTRGGRDRETARVEPEALDVVELARVVLEHVDDDVAEVHQDPRGRPAGPRPRQAGRPCVRAPPRCPAPAPGRAGRSGPS